MKIPFTKSKSKPRAFTGPTIKMFEFATLDFETKAIERRPNYPPKSVAATLKLPGDRKFQSFAWGLPVGNNCTKDQFKARLRDLWRSKLPIVAQHGKFDFEVAEKDFGLKIPSWERLHDTEYLLFLDNPHARSLALKESAWRILKMPPEERNELRDWILANCKGATKRTWGAFISEAPGSLVIPYMTGDGVRTEKLFKHLLPLISRRNMMQAYDRERHLMPILLRNEQEGIRCDMNLLEEDFLRYQLALITADGWLRKALGAKDLNLDAKHDVGEALDKSGIVTDWTWTKGGKGRAPQRSVSKKSLTMDKFNNEQVAMVWGYRNRLRTCLSMFMEPWLEIGHASNGMINTEWNQVRKPGDDDDDLVGTRTGRPSSEDPNFFNISKSFEDKGDGYKHPTAIPLPPLPLMRKYLLPDEGGVWGHRDYNQQELRVLAHFEDGGLKDHYCERPHRNPDGSMRFDIHTTVQEGVLRIAMLELVRTQTKILNFSDVYGKGEANLAESLGVDLETVKLIKKAKNDLMPGVKALIDDIKRRGKLGEAIRTWGGREYFAEEPMFVAKYGRVMDFCYKLINYLIQGSSADVTKEAMIRYDEHPKRQGRFLVAVYDEMNSSYPKHRVNEENLILRESMESIECDVPMLSDGKTGPNWAAIKSCWKELESERREFPVTQERWWEKTLAAVV